MNIEVSLTGKRISASEFLDILGMDAVLVSGNFGDVYVSDTVVAYRWAAESEWTMLQGNPANIDNSCRRFSAEFFVLLLDADTSIAIVCDESEVTFLPLAGNEEALIFVNQTGKPMIMINADSELENFLRTNEVAVQ